MYAPGLTKDNLATMAHLGLSLDDYASAPVEVWPCNEQAYELFSWARTQWIVSFGGPTGLNYVPLLHKMDRMRLEPDDYDELEAMIRIMEFAALEVMNEKD
jgi:hypothetical protein